MVFGECIRFELKSLRRRPRFFYNKFSTTGKILLRPFYPIRVEKIDAKGKILLLQTSRVYPALPGKRDVILKPFPIDFSFSNLAGRARFFLEKFGGTGKIFFQKFGGTGKIFYQKIGERPDLFLINLTRKTRFFSQIWHDRQDFSHTFSRRGKIFFTNLTRQARIFSTNLPRQARFFS